MKNNNIELVRHSLSHLMSMAVCELYPSVGLGVGPVIENGFYQDYDFSAGLSDEASAKSESFNPEILPKLEKRMRELIKKDIKFEQHDMDFDEALKLYKDDPYKTELINDLKEAGEKKVSFYKSGDFNNLCLGPHVASTKEIDPQAFKLTHIAGAYWRGNEKNKMLTRIYGLAFESKEKLDEYLTMQEEAKKRDHRKLGKELDLFTFSPHVGSGLPLFTPKGALVRRLLNDYIEKLQIDADYTQVWTPQIVKSELFKISGHYDKYKDSMFKVISNYSEEEYFLKPMNCPQHTQIYKSQPRSYKDLPLRYSDFAMLYRDEQPGELSGLARVRSFSQDDCHIFCREDQVDQEIDVALNMTKKVLETFGFKYRYRLSTRDPKQPEKYLGDPKTWDKVEKWAEEIMKRHKIDYFDGPGEAAFYAPKMDLLVTDALGREWQTSTLQIDFVMPERFDLEYTDKDGTKKRPVMLHRAILGSSERFMMILLEQYSGNLPLWLSPVQVKVIPVRNTHNAYAQEVYEMLKEAGIRVEVDLEDENLGKKVRAAKNEKIPYWIVVGDKEVESKEVTAESRSGEKIDSMSVSKLLDLLQKEIKDKK